MKTYHEYLQIVEDNLESQLALLGNIPQILRESMLYSLKAGGKRLRPVMLLAACDALNGDLQEAIPFACALEMIHTYSLIHDDLPAMDNDDLRRGRPTNHKVYGEGMAILAGDGLLHAAAQIMMKQAVKMNSMRGVKAAEAIMRRAGVTGMVAGQVIDVTQEGTEPTAEKVQYIHLHKTADLLTAPMEAGALLAGADEEALKACIEYGQNIGLAFQMVDDLLDVQGDASVLGKNTGMDAQLGKLTWIAVHGIEKTRQDADEYIQMAVENAKQFEKKNENFFQTLALDTRNRVK